MNYWFDLSSKELYSNSERLNSDVCFFISKSSNEVHSGIHPQFLLASESFPMSQLFS